MSVKYFVTFKDKQSRGSDVTSGHGKKLSIFVYIFTFSPFFFYVIQKYNSEYFYHKKH